MALVCKEIQEWVEEQVSKPIEEWENQQQEKCKNYPWYDPRGWVCWLVWVLVKVTRWVVVTVGKWVIRTVCTVVTIIIDMIVAIATGLWDVVAGIFTLDWRRIVDGLLTLGIGVVKGIANLIRVALLGDTIDFIREEIEKGQLRDHVRDLLEQKYDGRTLQAIKDAIRLDAGAFGLRMNATAFRTTLDSETPSPTEPAAPNLVVLHETGAINLRELCGFEFTEGFWNRKRYKTLKKGIVVSGGGGGEFDNPISASELDTYLSTRGADGPEFIVFPMRDGVLDTKLTAAEDKGRQLGLMISWERELVPVTTAGHIRHNGFDTSTSGSSLVSFLDEKAGRTLKSLDPVTATRELGHPVAVGIFRYTDTLRGLASPLAASACGLGGANASGATFIDNKPDDIMKYVPIHELGHYFGLCHVDGLDRIMVSTREKSWWSWSLLPNLLYLKGEPYFTLDEAKAAWTYIIANFDAATLSA